MQILVEQQQDDDKLSCLWVAPHPRTIEFSEKKHNDMFKQFQHYDQVKLDEIGHTFQLEILSAVKEASESVLSIGDCQEADNQNEQKRISLENRVFLQRMGAFVQKIPKWATRDEQSRMALLDWMKVDLLYITDLQNLFSEYLQHYVAILQRDNGEYLSVVDGGPNGPFSNANVALVIHTLRLMISQAQNCAFFGCLQSILQITTKHRGFKDRPLAFQREQLAIYEKLTIIVEILFHHMYNQKRPFQMLFSSQEKWDTNFKLVATNFQDYCNGVIGDFASLAQLLIYKGGTGAPEHLKALQEQEGCDLASHLAKLPKQCDLLVSDSLEDIRECFRLQAFTMSLLMGQYFDLVKQQKVMFESHMDPAKVVQNLILIIGSPDPYFTPKVRVSAIKVLEFLCELDTHPEFRYSDERTNPYFEVICKNFQDYVSICKRFAEFYSPQSLNKFIEEMRERQNEQASAMQIDEEARVSNMQRGSSSNSTSPTSNVFSSQKFLRSFLSFMFVLVSMRTRSMQTQLFPQLIEPMVRIITVMPRDNSYIVNLDCQKSALQILKEIHRSNIFFDDESHIVLLIERLKIELSILKDDYDSFEVMDTFGPQKLQWLPFRYDDSFVHQSHTMAKRQDLIGSFLRFLCYSIIRMDPNQISINQNFVAHSRKILESNIFEDCLRELVFENNPSKESNEDKTRYEKVIDPIYMTCVQLYSYVFNDLLTKIDDYIANGLLPCIVESLSRRIPRQKDFLVLTCKFMRLLLLKDEGTKLLLNSRILANVQELAMSHESYNELVCIHQNRDSLTLISQLAAESQELSDQMLQTNVANLWKVIDKSWELTAEYLECEKINAQPDQTLQQVEQRKDSYSKIQSEFERVVENVCYMLLFQVHELYETIIERDNQQAQSNVERSIEKQTDLIEVIKTMITTPTICSAASNFLIIFGDIASVIMMKKSKDVFVEYIDWLGKLLQDQIASLKTILGVDKFHLFDPADLAQVEAQEAPALVESNPEKQELLFRTYKLSGEDLVWVTVAKIQAYIDLLLMSETLTRQLQSKTFNQECINFFLRPEISQSDGCLRTDILLLAELLKRFQHWKFCDKFEKKINRKGEILARFEDKIKLVDWSEFTTILEPHNDYEQALNLYYTFEYAQVDSFKIEDATEAKSKFRIMLNPSEDEIPESGMCKKKCLFFVNRINSIYRREKQFDIKGENVDLKKYSDQCANVCKEIISGLAERCMTHLRMVHRGDRSFTVEGVDMELIQIKLQMTPLLTDISQLLIQNTKATRSAPTAFFINSLLENGILESIFSILDWAAQVLLAYDSSPKAPQKKLLLHQQVLHDCILLPMNVVSVLITGEFLRRELKYFLQPNEMSINVAILKLKLSMMKHLFQPMVEFFIEQKASQFLIVADKYDHVFSKLLEGVYCILCANSFFTKNLAFDSENLKQIRAAMEKKQHQNVNTMTGAPDSMTDRFQEQTQQLVEMGFDQMDVENALGMCRNDFERALDYLCTLGGGNSREQQNDAARPNADTQDVQQQTQEEVKQAPFRSAEVEPEELKSQPKKPQDHQKPEAPKVQQPSQQDSMVAREAAETSIGGTGAAEINPDFLVGDIKEVEAANELEFRQRRKHIIKVITQSLVWILPSHLTRASNLERERILTGFLQQVKREDDSEVKECLKQETLAMIQRLLERLQQQSVDSQVEGTGVDWLFINTLKWTMASDQFKVPEEFTLGSLGSTLADQLHRNISQMGSMLRYEKPTDETLDKMNEAEKRQSTIQNTSMTRQISGTLFNIFHYVRIVALMCEQLKSFQNLQCLLHMITEAEKTAKPDLEDLRKIAFELQSQFKTSDFNYFKEQSAEVNQHQEGATTMQIDTTAANRQTSTTNSPFNLQIDQDKAGSHLQAYFTCFMLFFKEIGQVSGYFHESFQESLNKIFNKALRCIKTMAQIGQIGQFDFVKSFQQKNLLKALLHAKVLDKHFKIDSDVWRMTKKPEGGFPLPDLIEKHARMAHQESLLQFRLLIREVTTPKKEIQKRLEISLKRQLYKQFLSNFKRGEQIDFVEYLQSLQSASTKRREDSPHVQRAAASNRDTNIEGVVAPGQQRQVAKTKGKGALAHHSMANMTKPMAKPSMRAKSEEKMAANVQQGSSSQQQKRATQGQNQLQNAAAHNQNNTAARANANTQHQVPSKLLKKVIVKYDEYNQSKLDDFINFNRVALDDQFTMENLSLLQACSRIAVIKTVEVDAEVPESKYVEVIVKDPQVTTEADVMSILTEVYGKVEKIKKMDSDGGTESDNNRYSALFEDLRCKKEAIRQEQVTMTLRGQVHTITIKDNPELNQMNKNENKKPPKEELRIMLKRHVLKEMIYDPDFNQLQNVALFGQSASTGQDYRNVQTCIMPSKIQTETIHQLLEMIVEQTRGLKMDTLKIIRNPAAFMKQDRTEPVFVSNDTVLKILSNDSASEEERKDSKQLNSQQKSPPKLVVDKTQSSSISKQYYLDYTAIMSGLTEILEKQPTACETVLRHNDGKTLKFILRNIFYIMSAQIDGKNDNQVVFRNMHYQHSQKLSDRLQFSDRLHIMLAFLKTLTTITKSSTLKQQIIVQDIQKILVSLMSKNLINSNHQRQSNKHNAAATTSGVAFSEACSQLVESSKLVAQYNTVWILTQFLFHKPIQSQLVRPEDCIINQAIKLDEQVKLHIVKLVLLETQRASQANQTMQLQQLQQQQQHDSSDLAFLGHIKKLLDNLEACKFMFTAKSKVPCMHMCIWAVTSILKIFENRSELFMQISGGPPPPPSDSEMDDQESQVDQDEDQSRQQRRSATNAAGQLPPSQQQDISPDLEMRSDNAAGAGQAPSSQPVNAAHHNQNSSQLAAVEASNNNNFDHGSDSQSENENEDEDEEEDDDDEEGEEDVSESDSYGSMDFMEGNEDLSSNRGDQSFAGDQDMLEDHQFRGAGADDVDEFDDDEDSYDSSDYGDEDSSALIEILPRVAVSTFAPVKGGGGAGSLNDDLSALENLSNPAGGDGPLYASVGGGQDAARGGDGDDEDAENVDRAVQGAVMMEDESYYSHEELESYEPPLSYDQENDSLSFASNEDNFNQYGDMQVGQDGAHNDMDAFDDFDNASAEDSIISEDESHNHHHQHGGVIHHSIGYSHNMPLHSQLWHQVGPAEIDPLESEAIKLTTALNSVLESVSVQNWPYKSFILGISTGSLGNNWQNATAKDKPVQAETEQQRPEDEQQQQQTGTTKVFKDEQGEEVVQFQNPEIFKDQPNAPKEAPIIQAQQQPVPNAVPQSSSLYIEDLDPLFYETVDPKSLQNIADSHNIQNNVVNSANQIARDRDNQPRFDNLQRIISGYRDQNRGTILLENVQRDLQNRTLPPNVTQQSINQILSVLQNSLGETGDGQSAPTGHQTNVASGQPQLQSLQIQQSSLPNNEAGRGRFMSIDTVAVSMLGPNDASRQITNNQDEEGAGAGDGSLQYLSRPNPNNPHHAAGHHNHQHHNLAGDHKDHKVKIRGSQFMQNSFNDLQDMIARFQKNSNVSHADKQCQDILKQHLLPQQDASESAEDQFKKIHDSMQIALIGFKIFNRDDLQIQSRIRLLFRIPSLRICLILRVLKLLTSEVDNLVRHRDACSQTKEYTPYHSSEKMPYQVDDKDQQIILHEMPLDKTIYVSLSIIEQLQECLQNLGNSKAVNQQSIEIAKVISSDELLSKFAALSGLENLEFSVIESILICLQRYFDVVVRDPWVLPLEKSKQAQKTALYNNVLASFKKILQPLSKVPKLAMPVRRICELVVAPSFVKMTKVGHQNARKILNEFKQPAFGDNSGSEQNSLAIIGSYMENRLEVALKAIIGLLETKRTALEQESNYMAAAGPSSSSSEKFIQHLDETKELLKLTSGVQKIKNTNICRQDTLSQLFTIANAILAKEQKHVDTKQVKQNSTNAFMYRNDIKEMILLLFALCEYNLRIVFNTGGQLQQSQTTADLTTTLTSQSPTKDQGQNHLQKNQESGDGDRQLQLIDTMNGATHQAQREEQDDQEMAVGGAEPPITATVAEQEEIIKMIERQVLVQHEQQASSVAATQTAPTESKLDTNQQQSKQLQTVQQLPQSQKFHLDKRLRTIIGFFIQNKKLINVFIRVNQQVVNVQLKNLVVKIPQILEFDTKRLIWRIMLKKTKQKVKGGQWEIMVNRETAFDESFNLMRSAKAEDWKTPMRVSFENEQGVDEGGLTKEWYTLLSKHMFNEDMALFLRASQGSTYFPNPKSIVQADHLELFEFIGKFVGKAMMDQQLLECYFVKAFYKLILDMPLDYSDLEDYDQELYKSLTWILKNEGAENLCSYFVDTQDYFGESKNTDLCEGGSDRLVTDENKEEYVKLVANYRLKEEISQQLSSFKSGLFSVVPKDLLKIFDNRELELLISGLQVVDIDDLRENTVYEGYTANSKTIQIFWEALRDFDNSERAEFIQFVTGSSKVPVEGFKGLRGQNGIQKFTITMINSSERLPQSHTCVNQLDLPQYKDKETMKRQLLFASKEGKTFTIA